MSESPPPLPAPRAFSAERAWITYVRAAGFLLPGILAMTFLQIVLIPKLKKFFELTQEQSDTSKVGYWFENLALFVPKYTPFILGGIVLIFVALELCVKRWPRYRGLVVMFITVICNALLMLGVVAVALSMGIAGPRAGMQLEKMHVTKP